MSDDIFSKFSYIILDDEPEKVDSLIKNFEGSEIPFVHIKDGNMHDQLKNELSIAYEKELIPFVILDQNVGKYDVMGTEILSEVIERIGERGEKGIVIPNSGTRSFRDFQRLALSMTPVNEKNWYIGKEEDAIYKLEFIQRICEEHIKEFEEEGEKSIEYREKK